STCGTTGRFTNRQRRDGKALRLDLGHWRTQRPRFLGSSNKGLEPCPLSPGTCGDEQHDRIAPHAGHAGVAAIAQEDAKPLRLVRLRGTKLDDRSMLGCNLSKEIRPSTAGLIGEQDQANALRLASWQVCGESAQVRELPLSKGRAGQNVAAGRYPPNVYRGFRFAQLFGRGSGSSLH